MTRLQVVKFNTIATSIIASVNRGTVVSILPLADALRIDPNILAINVSQARYNNTSLTNLTNETFYNILLDDGTSKIYADSWIDYATLTTPPLTKTLTITIVGDLSTTDINYVSSFVKTLPFDSAVVVS